MHVQKNTLHSKHVLELITTLRNEINYQCKLSAANDILIIIIKQSIFYSLYDILLNIIAFSLPLHSNRVTSLPHDSSRETIETHWFACITVNCLAVLRHQFRKFVVSPSDKRPLKLIFCVCSIGRQFARRHMFYVNKVREKKERKMKRPNRQWKKN